MRVILADLFHTFAEVRNPDSSPYTVPLAIGYIAAMVKRHVPEAEVSLFRDPDRFMARLRADKPRVVGFTFTSWNRDLSCRAAIAAKTLYPDVVTVAGGPSIDDQDEEIADFLRRTPMIDFVVPSEGEHGMVALMSSLRGTAAEMKDGTVIPGVAYLDAQGKLVRGRYIMPLVSSVEPAALRRMSSAPAADVPPDLDSEIPSPYLEGILDSFLAEGLVPILQTMRGCPYRCEFCVSGTTLWNKPRGFHLERVKAELAYVLAHGKSNDLILTDENWGILGDRDVELAEHIMRSHRDGGRPARLYYYTAKMVDDAARDIVERVAPIAWIGEFSMSFQSLNPATRKAIQRTNISLDKLARNVAWANERRIITASEMIYGFPHETAESFFDGVETLLRAGMHKVTIYPLQLFSGIDLASRETREKYGLKTRFRLADSACGSYDGGNLVAVESEEVVVETNTSTIADYLRVRRYSFFQMAMLGKEFLQELVHLCGRANIPMASLIRYLATSTFDRYPTLSRIMSEYNRGAEAELMDSHDAVYAAVSERIRLGQPVAGVKLNYVYLGRIMSSAAAIAELIDAVREFVLDVMTPLEDERERDVILSYVGEVLPHRIVLLEPAVQRDAEFASRFDYGKWRAQAFERVEELLTPEPRVYRTRVPEVLERNLQRFDASSPAALQAIFDRTPSRKMLREVVC